MADKKSIQVLSIILIILGIALFVARYIPFYEYQVDFSQLGGSEMTVKDNLIRLDWSCTDIQTFYDKFPICRYAPFLNKLFIALSIGLILSGILLFSFKNKIVKNLSKSANKETKNKKTKISTLAILSLVCGILSFFLGLIPILLALIFGVISLFRIKKNKNLLGYVYAIIGIILAIIPLIIMFLMMIFVSSPGAVDTSNKICEISCSDIEGATYYQSGGLFSCQCLNDLGEVVYDVNREDYLDAMCQNLCSTVEGSTTYEVVDDPNANELEDLGCICYDANNEIIFQHIT
jgi:hypothetical protein